MPPGRAAFNALRCARRASGRQRWSTRKWEPIDETIITTEPLSHSKTQILGWLK